MNSLAEIARINRESDRLHKLSQDRARADLKKSTAAKRNPPRTQAGRLYPASHETAAS